MTDKSSRPATISKDEATTGLADLHESEFKGERTCEAIEAAVNVYLEREAGKKRNTLSNCDESHDDCSCGRPVGEETAKLVDLVVLLDSSGSMNAAATAVSNAAKTAVEMAAKECPSDLRVTWLVVDSAKPGADAEGYLGDITSTLAGTPFTLSHQQYLGKIGATGPLKQDEAQPLGDATYPGEEGADSIADLCNFYDWRKEACKAIFYISDTKLDGYSAFDAEAAANAKTAALGKGVVLFAHHIGSPDPVTAEMQNYLDMCKPTGGSVYFGPVDSDQYTVLLKNAICNACGSGCKEVELPKMEPCVSIAWGDSDCDCFETDDVEVAMVTMCNCYSNISFSNLHVGYFDVTMFDGTPVPLLPDGTPSVSIHPMGPVCFGDIGPCVPCEPNCVSREIVIRTRGAKSGPYKVTLRGICYEVVLVHQMDECFVLTLCAD